jgi:carboxymethylenebutenolidase
MDITTKRVEIPANGGGTMGGYLARPDDGEVRPAVIVFMEIFGINSHIRDIVERVAREGYVAIAPDFFHRTGPGAEQAYDDDGMAAGMVLLGQLDADEMISDARDTVAWLRDRDDVRGDRIGCIGFCIGGHMAYLTACETDVQAAASFYGGGIAAPEGMGGKPSTIGRTEKMNARILCLFGAEDGFIPQEQVEAIKAKLGECDRRYEVVVYDGADHGFHCDQRPAYHKEAAKDAWERVKVLFQEELVS